MCVTICLKLTENPDMYQFQTKLQLYVLFDEKAKNDANRSVTDKAWTITAPQFVSAHLEPHSQLLFSKEPFHQCNLLTAPHLLLGRSK